MLEASTIAPNSCTFFGLELTLGNAPNQPGPQKSIFLAIPAGRRIPLGFCALNLMFLFTNTQKKTTPLAIEPAEDDGRYRLFWAEQYVGGLWSAPEVAQIELAPHQSRDELIVFLDCVAANSVTLERLPP